MQSSRMGIASLLVGIHRPLTRNALIFGGIRPFDFMKILTTALQMGVFIGSIFVAPLLMADAVLFETRFGEGERTFDVRKGLDPEPRAYVINVPDGPRGEAATVFHFDDSHAIRGSASSQYFASLPMPKHEASFVTISIVLRVPAEGGDEENRQGDFRICAGGKNVDGNHSSASYIRVMSTEGEGRWTIYNQETQKHQRIDVPLRRGEWYLLKKRFGRETYDWSLESLGADPKRAEGSNEPFYQPTDNITVITINSLERGGAFEVAEVKVEAE